MKTFLALFLAVLAFPVIAVKPCICTTNHIVVIVRFPPPAWSPAGTAWPSVTLNYWITNCSCMSQLWSGPLAHPPTNGYVPIQPPTNTPPRPIPVFVQGIPTYNILEIASPILDEWATNTPSHYYYSLCSFSLQSSTNLVNWREEVSITNWVSQASICTVAYTNGVPINTNKVAASSMDAMILIAPPQDSPAKFFRVAQ